MLTHSDLTISWPTVTIFINHSSGNSLTFEQNSKTLITLQETTNSGEKSGDSCVKNGGRKRVVL